MARYLLFLIFLLAFAGITAGIISLMFRRVGQWNYIVKGVAERYGGTLKPGGVLSNPAMYFTYNNHYCQIRFRKLKTLVAGNRITEFTTAWTNRNLTFALITKNLQVPKIRSKVEIYKTGNADFDQLIDFYSDNSSIVERILNKDVCWQIEQLCKLSPTGYIRITIANGVLSIIKPSFIRETTQLDDFTRYSVELLDQLRLAHSEGIDFEEQQDTELVEEVFCPICSEEILDQMVVCVRCKTPHCRDCWEYNGQCAMFACRETRFLNASASVSG